MSLNFISIFIWITSEIWIFYTFFSFQNTNNEVNSISTCFMPLLLRSFQTLNISFIHVFNSWDVCLIFSPFFFVKQLGENISFFLKGLLHHMRYWSCFWQIKKLKEFASNQQTVPISKIKINLPWLWVNWKNLLLFTLWLDTRSFQDKKCIWNDGKTDIICLS